MMKGMRLWWTVDSVHGNNQCLWYVEPKWNGRGEWVGCSGALDDICDKGFRALAKMAKQAGGTPPGPGECAELRLTWVGDIHEGIDDPVDLSKVVDILDLDGNYALNDAQRNAIQTAICEFNERQKAGKGA
jgi:hypothetical protein